MTCASLAIVGIVAGMFEVVGVVIPKPKAFTEFLVDTCAVKIKFTVDLVFVLY